jgi:hypothetical protein
MCLSLTTTRLTCLTFQKLFRKNLNRTRLGCKNTTFKGFDANDFWEKYGGADDLLRRMTLRDDHFVDDTLRVMTFLEG